MAETQPCPACEGCGKLASHNSKPWTQFQGLSYFSEGMEVVREGKTDVLVCVACGGSGVEAKKPEKSK